MRGAFDFVGDASNGRTLLLYHYWRLGAHRALRVRLLQTLGEFPVDLMYMFGAVLALGLFGYLLVAMLFPERFS
jgi:K+-transporting ATPase KdpF subunit